MRKLAVVFALFATAFAAEVLIPYTIAPITTITALNPAGPWPNTVNTHIAVDAWIIEWRGPNGFDGDRHLNICDASTYLPTGNGGGVPNETHCIVGEIPEYISCVPLTGLPKKTKVYGTLRYDPEHYPEKRWEIHPIERIDGTNCVSKSDVDGSPYGSK